MELLLGNLGHRVLINAGTLTESVRAIETLEDTLDVALVDGTLEPDSAPMSDGITIAHLLREKFGDSVTVASVSGQGTLFEGADVSLPKHDARAIADFIDQLPERSQP